MPALEDLNRLTQWDTPTICNVVIPQHAVTELPAAIDLISRREEKIISATKADDFDFEKLRAAIASAGEIH